jgi:hypothetical protein
MKITKVKAIGMIPYIEYIKKGGTKTYQLPIKNIKEFNVAQPPPAKGSLYDISQLKNDPKVMWHGSTTGELKGGTSGVHVGTHKAAKEALEARIGIKADGTDWSGATKYGDTLLAGQDTLRKLDPRGYNKTGFNVDVPKNDFYIRDYPQLKAKYSGGAVVSLDTKPTMTPVRIKGQMSNVPDRPMGDFQAGGRMKGLLERGKAKSGYYYKNVGEDAGSISAVVPSRKHLEVIKPNVAQPPVSDISETVYHGTSSDVDLKDLSPEFTGKNIGGTKLAKGIYFSNNLDDAKSYSTYQKDIVGVKGTTPKIIEAEITNAKLKTINSNDFVTEAIAKPFRDQGYDGILRKGIGGSSGFNEYIIFNPKVLKQPQAQPPPAKGRVYDISKELEPLAKEARKYKSAKEFVDDAFYLSKYKPIIKDSPEIKRLSTEIDALVKERNALVRPDISGSISTGRKVTNESRFTDLQNEITSKLNQLEKLKDQTAKLQLTDFWNKANVAQPPTAKGSLYDISKLKEQELKLTKKLDKTISGAEMNKLKPEIERIQKQIRSIQESESVTMSKNERILLTKEIKKVFPKAQFDIIDKKNARQLLSSTFFEDELKQLPRDTLEKLNILAGKTSNVAQPPPAKGRVYDISELEESVKKATDKFDKIDKETSFVREQGKTGAFGTVSKSLTKRFASANQKVSQAASEVGRKEALLEIGKLKGLEENPTYWSKVDDILYKINQVVDHSDKYKYAGVARQEYVWKKKEALQRFVDKYASSSEKKILDVAPLERR